MGMLIIILSLVSLCNNGKLTQKWTLRNTPGELAGRGSETTETHTTAQCNVLHSSQLFSSLMCMLIKHHILYVWTSQFDEETNGTNIHGKPCYLAFSNHPYIPTPVLSQCAIHNHNPHSWGQDNKGDTTKWFLEQDRRKMLTTSITTYVDGMT